jgi:hypothetical protein
MLINVAQLNFPSLNRVGRSSWFVQLGSFSGTLLGLTLAFAFPILGYTLMALWDRQPFFLNLDQIKMPVAGDKTGAKT